MKKIGFLSFGTWTPAPQSQTRLQRPTRFCNLSIWPLRQRRLARTGPIFAFTISPANSLRPSLAGGLWAPRPAVSKSERRVIDMRDQNPLYMVEDASASDLIACGRLGSPPGISWGLARVGDRRGGSHSGGTARLRVRVTPTLAACHMQRFSSTCCAVRASPSRTRGRCFPTAGPAARRAPFRGPARSDLVGAPAPTPPWLGRQSWG